jgi:murein L,D-transpeptidase YcbB/YkuD
MEMIAAATPAVESDQPAAPVVAMFDTELETAVRAFQARNGLKSDGVVGANTYAALNATAASRAAQIAVNMEQARWRNRPLGRKYILVNIPDFHVDVVEDGRIALRSRVIVGKARKHQTPEFSDEITHMVVNPRWNVPHSIASEEFLPELQSDPGALRRRNISIYSPRGGVVDPLSVDWSRISQETFPFSMAQSPGPGNALGNVKFMFPNRYAVYLHDTPGRSLFQRSMRAFSHGCVRVAKPRELAEVLLRPQSNDPRGRFEFLRSKPGEQYERLKQTVPVHIVYRTAWIDAQGDVQLRRDIYGRDQKIAAALARVGLTL